MKHNHAYRIIFLAALGLLAACTGNRSGDGTTVVFKYGKGEPLAQVGKVSLSLEEMSEDFLGRQGTFRGAPNLNTEKKRSDYVENEVMQEAMFQEAIALDYFNNPEVKRNIKKIVVQKLMRDKLEKAQTDYVPTEEEMKEHYEKNNHLYKRGDSIKVAYHAIPFGNNQSDAKNLAQSIQKEAAESVKNASTKDFARLSIKHAQAVMSKVKVAMETNETSYLEKADFEAKFGPVYDSIKNMANLGQIGPILSHNNTYYVMMKTGDRKAINESMEEAKDKIQKRVAFERRGKTYENYLADLRKKYDIKIFQDKLPLLSTAADKAGKAAASTAATGGAGASSGSGQAQEGAVGSHGSAGAGGAAATGHEGGAGAAGAQVPGVVGGSAGDSAGVKH